MADNYTSTQNGDRQILCWPFCHCLSGVYSHTIDSLQSGPLKWCYNSTYCSSQKCRRWFVSRQHVL